MVLWENKTECTGCGACVSVCPRDALKMEMQEDGFYYPIVQEHCIACGSCVQVCRSRESYAKEHDITVYAAWSKDEKLRLSSTSGGLFGQLALEVLRQGGVVVGAAFDEENMVEHRVIDQAESLGQIKKSKYVQSRVETVYEQVRDALAKRKVLFCGTPCQVAGLKAYLGKAEENLLTADFICKGNCSPKAYRAWLTMWEEAIGSKITEVEFKCKKYGWKSSPYCIRLGSDGGERIVSTEQDNLYMASYLKYDMITRTSCQTCEFKGRKHASDITLGDFWGVEKEYDDDKGTSVVIVHTAKGERLLSAIAEDLVINKKTEQDILGGNYHYRKGAKVHKDQVDFMRELDQSPYDEAYRKYCR